MSDITHVTEPIFAGSQVHVFGRLTLVAQSIVMQAKIEMGVKELLFPQFGRHVTAEEIGVSSLLTGKMN